jgi:hypothetical protein
MGSVRGVLRRADRLAEGVIMLHSPIPDPKNRLDAAS